MQSRIGAALLLTASVAAGTLGLAGTAAAQTTTDIRATAEVRCDNRTETASLVVRVNNRENRSVTVRVNPQGFPGQPQQRAVAARSGERFTFTSTRSRVDAGSVRVVPVGNRANAIDVRFGAADCVRPPRVNVRGIDDDGDRRLNAVRLRNNDTKAVTFQLHALDHAPVTLQPGAVQRVELNDRRFLGVVVATKVVGGKTYRSVELARA
jgi:hypothetical protein